MPLTGTYERNLDDKQRLAVPKRLKEQFGEGELTSLFVAPGTEKSLFLYSPQAFNTLAAKLSEKATNRVEIRNYLRLFYAQAEEVPLDSQGRIRVPERLVAFAELKKDLVLLGVHDHAEIWDKDVWSQFLATSGAQFDQLATQAFQ
ncbi:MAG: division/cell wall cluster transcriptional repressor MraZ [Planctomycetaceae bacterium]|nr:division/cell wall cluster transcriptional repressor MraZ [Planctomycetaceae bacterium]